MTWYTPRLLESIRFGGGQDCGDVSALPKQTEAIFSVDAVENIESVKEVAVMGADITSFSRVTPYKAPIVGSSVLTSTEALKKVYSVNIDNSGLCSWDWMPGDAFGIVPENDAEVVGYTIGRLGLDPSKMLRLNVIGKVAKESLAEFWQEHSQTVSNTITVLDFFTKHIDLTYFPKKACLFQLAEWCEDEGERKDLLYLASRAGSPHYLRIAGERTTILDFLNTFPSCNPPLEILLRHLPLLHPRFYSISNTKLDGSGSVEILFNTIEYETPEGHPRKGLCSSWIERAIKDSLPLSLVPRPNSTVFRPPTLSDTPLLMICAGTGISPFIGFIRHWKALGVHTDSWLLYGFRNMQHDYLFRQELEEALSDKFLGKMSLAISRQPDLGLPQYVQHALYEQKDLVISKLADPRLKIYICGDELSMVKEVNETLAKIVSESQNITAKEATAICLQWTKEGRIIRDIWI